jgi:hypothetical protein
MHAIINSKNLSGESFFVFVKNPTYHTAEL